VILVVPVPFSFALLALGRPVDVTNISGLLVLMAYTFGLLLLHRKLGIPIIPAIALAAAGYCLLGGTIASIIPKTQTAFLIALLVVYAAASILHSALPNTREDRHQSPLPVWKKFLAIACVIFIITVIKSFLQGFMTVFPMLGVIVAYESRKSLYTVCRHIPVAVLTLAPMITTIYLLQERIGLVPALLVSWGIFLAVLPFYIIPLWKKYDIDNKERITK